MRQLKKNNNNSQNNNKREEKFRQDQPTSQLIILVVDIINDNANLAVFTYPYDVELHRTTPHTAHRTPHTAHRTPRTKHCAMVCHQITLHCYTTAEIQIHHKTKILSQYLYIIS